MRTILKLTLALSMLLTATTWAQQGTKTKQQHDKNAKHKITQEERVKRKADLLKGQLALSDIQTKKITEAIVKRNNSLIALKSKIGENKDIFKAEALPIRKQFQTDLKNILNAEQLAKFKEIRKANRHLEQSAKPAPGDDLIDETEPDLNKN
jgi:hypothetical protein